MIKFFLGFTISFLVFCSAQCRTKVGDQFPAIDVNLVNSKAKFDSSLLRGKVVLVGIWSSNCDPCRLAMLQMNSMYLKYRDRN